MIGLDTNVLARYLAGDPAHDTQVAKAITAIDAALGKRETLYVNLVVVSETYWVLSRHYNVPRKAILDALMQLLNHEGFEVESASAIRKAIKNALAQNADFADCLIAELNRTAGCAHTLSFDKKAARKLGFKSP
jgi:predicted nucleic-acid-binding protein